MAIVSFKRGLVANLPATYTEGTFYVATDERAIYLDVSDAARIRLGDFQEFATVTELNANPNPSTTALYYVSEINCLAKWDGSKYVQINRDTGMTSVEVVGDGNALTAAVYDEAGRKLTLTKGATYMTAGDVDTKIGAKVGTLKIGETEYENVTAYVDAKTAGIATDAQLENLTDEVSALKGKVDTEGKVSEAISGAIDDLDLANTYAPKTHGHTISEVTGLQDALDGKQAAGDYAAAKDLSDLKAKVGDIPASATATTVVGYVDEKIGAIPAQTDYTVAVEATTPEGVAKRYTITQAATGLNAVIDIPKDMVVESGSVETKAETGAWGEAGTYLHLVLANAEESDIYINAADLIEYVTGDVAADGIITTAVDANHVLTATIGDGKITLAKLEASIQTAIGKAHNHANKAELDKIADGDKAKWDAAEAKAHEHANKTILDGISQDKVDAWDGAVAKEHEHANATVLDGITAEKVTAWDAAEQNAKDYADGLAGNYDAKGDADTAESNAKAYTDGLLTWGAF